MSLTAKQAFALEATERVCSVLSLVGTTIIIGTFIGSNLFRKPINRLVFYASWGNIMSNIATLISISGISHGISSPLCQFQGFLIQWFMPADALWTLAMALNVYLTFFHKYDSSQIRKLEWKYVIFCYGIPFIPAFSYFFIETKAKGKIYGSAVLWCWVSLPWDVLRIAVFYGPVWFVIALTLAIYTRAGSVIFEKRRQLRDIGTVGSNYYLENPLEDVSKVTEIHVTSERVVAPSKESTQTGDSADDAPPRPQSSSYSPYSITIETGKQEEQKIFPMRHLGTNHSELTFQRHVATIEANKAAWAYCKCAMLFFIALLVTWVPSTVNRLYTLVNPDKDSFGLNYASGFVLPLQGFWNSIIYLSISWPAVKASLSTRRRRPQSFQISRPFPFSNANTEDYSRHRARKDSDGNKSTSQLAMHPQGEGAI